MAVHNTAACPQIHGTVSGRSGSTRRDSGSDCFSFELCLKSSGGPRRGRGDGLKRSGGDVNPMANGVVDSFRNGDRVGLRVGHSGGSGVGRVSDRGRHGGQSSRDGCLADADAGAS